MAIYFKEKPVRADQLIEKPTLSGYLKGGGVEGRGGGGRGGGIFRKRIQTIIRHARTRRNKNKEKN